MAEPLAVELFHLERLTAVLDTPAMAKVREQFLDIEAESPPAINLGGLGGAAPGAGGGGGGAMGLSATGGPGGTGGNLNINLDGAPGEAPGAGGGGAGATGDDAVGGGGGEGGEYFTTGPIDVGPDTGIHHLEFRVGRGGIEGPGENTIVNFCTEDGRVVRSLTAKGGDPGAHAYVPPTSRTPTDEDLEAGLKVTSILAANVIYPRNGLWSVLDGGWDFYMAETNPFRLPLPLLVEVETGLIEPETIIDLRLIVRSPDGFRVHEYGQAIVACGGMVRRSRFAVALEISGSEAGVWHVEVLAGPRVIGDFPIEIRVPVPQ